jgi:hypothetical protein
MDTLSVHAFEAWASDYQVQYAADIGTPGAIDKPAVATAWGSCGDQRGIAVLAASSGLWRKRGNGVVDERAVQAALRKDATARRIIAKKAAPVEGDTVGVRLNLNILKSQGVSVHSLHRGGGKDLPMKGGGFWNGEVLDYRAVVTLRNAWFSVHQRGREAIAAARQAKHPMASIDGELCAPDANTDGIEARFNPKATHLFVDEQGHAIRWAESVTIIGHRAYTRGTVVYHDEDTSPVRASDAHPSIAKLLQR